MWPEAGLHLPHNKAPGEHLSKYFLTFRSFTTHIFQDTANFSVWLYWSKKAKTLTKQMVKVEKTRGKRRAGIILELSDVLNTHYCVSFIEKRVSIPKELGKMARKTMGQWWNFHSVKIKMQKPIQSVSGFEMPLNVTDFHIWTCMHSSLPHFAYLLNLSSLTRTSTLVSACAIWSSASFLVDVCQPICFPAL